MNSAMPASSSSCGAGSAAWNGSGDGATVAQPRASSAGSWPPPSHGRFTEALRPAWPSWMPSGIGDQRRTLASTCANAASVPSSHRPRSAQLMRPRGSTAVASRISRPAPDCARLPRCMACQSLARPSSAEYWHIGAMTMRLDRVRGPNEIGENSWLKTVMNDVGGAYCTAARLADQPSGWIAVSCDLQQPSVRPALQKPSPLVEPSPCLAQRAAHVASASAQSRSSLNNSRSSARVRPRFSAATGNPAFVAACTKRKPE